jgi:hypothetical protein
MLWPSEPVVTVVTRGAAAAETLTDADYRDIYAELRTKTSLRQFVAAIHSAVSFGWWAKFETGAVGLDWARRNELRAAVGLAVLPVPPGLALAGAELTPDATVYLVGAGPVDRVALVGQAAGPLRLRLNGDLRVERGELLPEGGELATVRRLPTLAGRRRARRKSVQISPELWARLNAARGGMRWAAFLGRLVDLA